MAVCHIFLRALPLTALGLLCCMGSEASAPGDGGGTDSDAGPSDAPTDDGGAPIDGDPCPDLFDQDIFPTWRVDISGAEWAKLEDEFYNRVEREAAGLEIAPYHPVTSITYDDGRGEIPVYNVLIRLKGESSWVQTVQFDPRPKMQFAIAFNEVDKDARFMGVRKVELDMPRSDWTFLRQRLALYTMREIGQDAQCANNARLYINGEYYGLYTHLERLDKEFLQRVYGKDNGADDGDLWKAAVEIRTNEDHHSHARLNALWGATSVSQIAQLADLDEAVYEWATEAMLPSADGFQIGRPNFFVYDHPQRGFLWLPTDLDTGFDYYPYTLDLAFPPCSLRDYWFWRPYATTLDDPASMDLYIAALAKAHSRIDPAEQVALVDEWSAQIRDAAIADTRRPFSMSDHDWALSMLRDHVHLRDRFIDDWLACRDSGAGADWDGDGVVFCLDCDDNDPAVNPGAAEICNGVDDNCNGFADEGLSCGP